MRGSMRQHFQRREIAALATLPGAPNAPTLNSPADGATGIGTSPTLSVGRVRSGRQRDDGDLLRSTVRQRQLRPDRTEHGCRSGTNDDHLVVESRCRSEVRVVRHRQRRDDHHDRPDLDVPHHPERRSRVRGAGDIADCARTQDEATAAIISGIHGTVWTAGDNVYPDGDGGQLHELLRAQLGRRDQGAYTSGPGQP